MLRLIRRVPSILPTMLSFLVLSAAVSYAAERVNTDKSGTAIQGYDTVAYFTDGRPTKGKAEYAHEWQGAKWLFANNRHRELFVSDPNKYAPRYGGHCAGAMALGRVWTVDPKAWAIVDDRLYLNYQISGRDDFVKNPKPIIQRADANWKKLTK